MKKTALTFSLLLALSAVTLSGCDVKAKKVNGADGLFTVENTTYSSDDLFGAKDQKASYDLLSTDEGVKAVYESVFGSLAKANVERDAVIDQAVEDKMDDWDDEVESYANSNGVTKNNAKKSKLESLGFEKEADLKESYYVEEQKSELIEKFEDSMFETTKNDQASLLYRYVNGTKPMVVRHILTKIADSATIYSKAATTEDEIQKLVGVFQRLATIDASSNSFKVIAKEESEDTSASKGGNLGIVDTYTSFVSEFKLGMYVSEIERQTSDSAKKSVASALKISDETYNDLFGNGGVYENGIKTIDGAAIGAVLAVCYDDEAVELQKLNGHTEESKYDKDLYPRNYIYNKYLNSSSAKYLSFDLDGLDARIESLLKEVYGETYKASKLAEVKASTFYKAIQNTTVGADKLVYANEKPVVVAKSSYGFHFITIDWSTLDQASIEDAVAYFMYGSKSANTNTYVTNTDIMGYSTSSVAQSNRKTEIEGRVNNFINGGFESVSVNSSLYNYEVYEHYYANTASCAIASAEFEKAVNEMIELARSIQNESIEEARANSWESYIETIEAYNEMYGWLWGK